MSSERKPNTIDDRHSEELSEEQLSTVSGGTHPYSVADSFSFGVEREMKESGEKGGTADMNIGVGELEECTLSAASGSKFHRFHR